jgi:hypothetical protein
LKGGLVHYGKNVDGRCLREQGAEGEIFGPKRESAVTGMKPCWTLFRSKREGDVRIRIGPYFKHKVVLSLLPQVTVSNVF